LKSCRGLHNPFPWLHELLRDEDGGSTRRYGF
jgi:hypothetical protein